MSEVCFRRSLKWAVGLSMFLVAGTLRAQHEEHMGSPAPSNDRFSAIKALLGEWEGSFQWIGTDRKGSMSAKYYLTGNGSAVVEDLISEGKPTMTTVYHLNGPELRATHYCAAGNQPRLKAIPADAATGSVKFELIDITNLASPEAGHVKGLELRLNKPNELTILFTFIASGTERIEEIDLKRKS